MIKINIIPDIQKKDRLLEQKIGSILRFGLKIAFVFLFFSAILFSIQIILNMKYKAAKENSLGRENKSDLNIQEIEKLLADANVVSRKTNKTFSGVANRSELLEEISNLCPEDAKINSMHIEEKHVKLTGFSKTREAFLSLQENFKGAGFDNFVSPVSNLVSPQNFNFEIEFDIKEKT